MLARRLLMSAGGAVAILNFHALIYDSEDDYEMLLELTGTGSSSVTRTTTSYLLDHEDIYRYVEADTSIWQGGREVTNICPRSDTADYDTAEWFRKSSNVTLTGDPGNRIYSLTATSGRGIYTKNNISSVDIPVVIVSFELTPLQDGVLVLQIGAQITDLTKNYYVADGRQRITVATALDSIRQILFADISNKTGDLFIFHGIQVEDATGRADQVTPSEFIVTAADPVTKVFGNVNGNSVASNLVTESTGAALSADAMFQIDPPLTNNTIYSRDFTQVSWSKTSVTASYDQTGLAGFANTASKLYADAAGTITRQATLTTKANVYYVARHFIKKVDVDTCANDTIACALGVLTGVTAIGLNLVTGNNEWIDSGSGHNCHYVNHSVREFPSGWWEVILEVQADSAVANWGNSTNVGRYTIGVGVTNATVGDYMVVGNAELYENARLEQVKGTAPIYTSASTVSNDNQITEYLTGNFDETSDFAMTFELEGNVGEGTGLLIHSDYENNSKIYLDTSINDLHVRPGMTAVQHRTSPGTDPIGNTTAIHFEGDGGYTEITDTPTNYRVGASGSLPYHIALWVWVPDSTPAAFICFCSLGGSYNVASNPWTNSNGLEYILGMNTDGSIHWQTYDGDATPNSLVTALSPQFTNNTWHYVEVSQNETNRWMFVDGVIVASSAAQTTTTAGHTLSRFRLGRFANDGYTPYPERGTYFSDFHLSSVVGNTSDYSGSLPDAPVTPDANSKFHLAHSGNNGDCTVTDDSTIGATVNSGIDVYHTTSTSSVPVSSSSIYFNGTDGYLDIASESGWLDTVGTGDFEFSARIKLETSGRYHTIFANGYTSLGDLTIQTSNGASGNIDIGVWINGSQVGGTYYQTNLSTNTWYYLIVQRTLGTLYVYIDKVLIDSRASTQNIATDTDVWIGNGNIGGNYFKGWMDEIRFKTDDVDLIIDEDIPDTPWADPEPLIKNPIIATEDANTFLSIHSSTYDNDPEVEDSSYLEHVITETAGVYHDTAQKKYNSSSIYFNGTTGTFTMPDSSAWDLTGDFSLSLWLRPQSSFVSNSTVFGQRFASTVYSILYHDGSNLVYKQQGGIGGGFTLTFDTMPAGDTWTWILMQRVGSTITAYSGTTPGVAATVRGTTTFAGGVGLSQTDIYRFGYRNAGSYFKGWMDEIYFTKDVISSTIPTEPHDRGTLAQVEMVYIDPQGNLTIEDQGGVRAYKSLGLGRNKCGVFKESGNIGVTVAGNTSPLVPSSNNVGGNGNLQIGHGVTSPIRLRNIKGYNGAFLQDQSETDTS